MPLRISSQEESIKLIFLTAWSDFSRRGGERDRLGHKRRIFFFFHLCSFSFAFSELCICLGLFSFISRWHTTFRLSQNVQAFASVFGDIFFYFFPLYKKIYYL